MKKNYTHFLSRILGAMIFFHMNESFPMDTLESPPYLRNEQNCQPINTLKTYILTKLESYLGQANMTESDDEVKKIGKQVYDFSTNELFHLLQGCSYASLNELKRFFDTTINYQQDLNNDETLSIFRNNLHEFPNLLQLVREISKIDKGGDVEDLYFGTQKESLSIRLLDLPMATLQSLLDRESHPDNNYNKLKESTVNELKQGMFVNGDEVINEFDKLKIFDFYQNQFQASCLLYSILWGIHENEALTKELFKHIKKDINGNYYFENPVNKTVTMIPYDAVSFPKVPFSENQTEGSQFHPAKSEIIRAIGMYVLKTMNMPNEPYYLLYGDPAEGDYLLGQTVRLFSKDGPRIGGKTLEGDSVRLEDNGDIIVEYWDVKYPSNEQSLEEPKVMRKKERISGDLILSVSGTQHARVIYYNKPQSQWYYFDNQIQVDTTGIPITNHSEPLVKINKIEGQNLIGAHANEKNLKFQYIRVFGLFKAEPVIE